MLTSVLFCLSIKSFEDGRLLNALEQCWISSSVLLSGPPRRLSHGPIGMSSDNLIVIFSALSNDHKSLPLRPSDMVPLLRVS